MIFPFGQAMTLVVRIKGEPDRLGNDTWTTENVPIRGAFDPGSSVENTQGQDSVVTQPTAYLPSDTDITFIDAIRVDGTTYEVDGRPNHPVNVFTGDRPGVVVRLKGYSG